MATSAETRANDATVESKGLSRVVHKVIRATPPLSPGTTAAIEMFWQARRVRFTEITSARMVGHRGSLWWNALTFDMSRVKSDLTVTLDERAGTVACTLRVNTLLQTITEMNRRYWIEEMNAFESYLLHNDDRTAEWREFKRGYNKASIGWLFAIAVVATIVISSRELIGLLISWLAAMFGG